MVLSLETRSCPYLVDRQGDGYSMLETTLLTVLGVVLASVLSIGGVVLANISTRLRSVEDDLAVVRTKHARLWLEYRKLVDRYYRWKREDAPDPEPLNDEYI